MRAFLLIISAFFLFNSSALSKSYYVRVDSANYLKFKVGKAYKIKDQYGQVQKYHFVEIKNDSFIFTETKMHYKEITQLKNNKRKPILDALAYPLGVGACLGMSAFPVLYIVGYFSANPDRMFNATGLMLVETMIFGISRNYISRNDRWLDLSELKSLNYGVNK